MFALTPASAAVTVSFFGKTKKLPAPLVYTETKGAKSFTLHAVPPYLAEIIPAISPAQSCLYAITCALRPILLADAFFRQLGAVFHIRFRNHASTIRGSLNAFPKLLGSSKSLFYSIGANSIPTKRICQWKYLTLSAFKYFISTTGFNFFSVTCMNGLQTQ